MTTGRINQVTVRHASPRRGHTAPAAGATGPEFVTTASMTPAAGFARPPRRGLRSLPVGDLVPRISHVPGAFPRSSGPESTPSLKTARRRPPRGASRMRRISGRLTATRLGQRLASPRPSTSPATASKGLCGDSFSGSRATPATLPEPGLPFPERVHPARQAHRPHGPRRAGQNTVLTRPRQSHGARAGSQCLGPTRLPPTPRRSCRSTGEPARLLRPVVPGRRPNPEGLKAAPSPHRPSERHRPHLPSAPTAPDWTGGQTLVGTRPPCVLRPPCSRKRPILGGHGVKNVRRVRSVSTISRFLPFRLGRNQPASTLVGSHGGRQLLRAGSGWGFDSTLSIGRSLLKDEGGGLGNGHIPLNPARH